MITLDAENLFSYIDKADFDARMPSAIEALDSLLKREGAGREMLGWLDLPATPERDLASITETGKRIQDENDCLVVVGIGGSYLGARAAIEALPTEAAFPVYFAGNNLSPGYHDRLLSHLDGKRFSICVISKSGTTTEPAIAFRLLKRKLIEKFGRDGIDGRIIAITDPSRGALRQMAVENGWRIFDIPGNVGGRFSILSPVGLLPCAAAGIPVAGMIAGAASGLERYTALDKSNIAVRYALIRYLLHDKGTAIEVLSTFHPELAVFCEWWKQLAGESEGKNGKGLFPASTVMTTDLHSLGQLLQEGARDILETFLVAAHPLRDLTVPEEQSDLDNLNYLSGRSLGEINRKAFEGTRAAHISGGLPVLTLQIPSITPDAIGNLFVFFELVVAITGRLIDVNPFDQPGVEEYKSRMFKLLGKPGANG
ncbi:MAG: glucose-6-phosphate isomerase [Candidatus Krumholzibacteriota bacterium]|nr:glucose-6-phosphate isomerase [Candidatus Krumholzibacteriota bacterium]